MRTLAVVGCSLLILCSFLWTVVESADYNLNITVLVTQLADAPVSTTSAKVVYYKTNALTDKAATSTPADCSGQTCAWIDNVQVTSCFSSKQSVSLQKIEVLDATSGDVIFTGDIKSDVNDLVSLVALDGQGTGYTDMIALDSNGGAASISYNVLVEVQKDSECPKTDVSFMGCISSKNVGCFTTLLSTNVLQPIMGAGTFSKIFAIVYVAVPLILPAVDLFIQKKKGRTDCQMVTAYIGNLFWLFGFPYFSGGLYLLIGLIYLSTAVLWQHGMLIIKRVVIMVLLPFGRGVQPVNEVELPPCNSIAQMVFLIPFLQIIVVPLCYIGGGLQCLTIIGIPFGLQSFKIASLLWNPTGKAVILLNTKEEEGTSRDSGDDERPPAYDANPAGGGRRKGSVSASNSKNYQPKKAASKKKRKDSVELDGEVNEI